MILEEFGITNIAAKGINRAVAFGSPEWENHGLYRAASRGQYVAKIMETVAVI
jgi:hypothetical protein